MDELKSVMKFIGPSEDLRVAVSFPRRDGGPGPTKSGVRLSVENIEEFVPRKQVMDQAIKELRSLGFELTGRGRLTASMKCKRRTFEKVFAVKLKRKKIQIPPKESNAFYYFYYPPRKPRALWKPKPIVKRLMDRGLIDDVYIQWPDLFPTRRPPDKTRLEISGAGKPHNKPPKVHYYHLAVPKGVASLLRAKKVHCAGTTGKGIRVAMIDSGFEHDHPFFCRHGYTSKVILAGDAKKKDKDASGHGTGESANVFSVAPGINFIGVKIGNETVEEIFEIKPASLLEGFYKARRQNPDIISISGGHDLRYEKSRKQLANLPKSVRALEAEILHAVASGITVVASAGNGAFSFPGMMPDVISAGGVFVDAKRNMKASDVASAFDSKIYPGRHVPDICGLAGMKPKLRRKRLAHLGDSLDHYIMLPVPAGCAIDFGLSLGRDRTDPDDGWAPFGGTSAAAPQVAGVCALIKAKRPTLKPWKIKEILQNTAAEVLVGHSNQDSSDNRVPQKGVGATGAGLVDAFRAWQQA